MRDTSKRGFFGNWFGINGLPRPVGSVVGSVTVTQKKYRHDNEEPITKKRHRAGIVTDEMLTTPKWRFAVIGMLEALGVVTRMYCAGDSLQVKVNKLFFVKSPLPYHYYYLIYCKPKHNQNSVENLGILDNLSVVVLRQRRDESQSTTYEHGLRVGFKGNYVGSKEDKYFINNHLSFRVMYHKDLETDSARIIGFEVTPNSINQEYKEWDEKNP
nr:hypothetical protein [Tanacetum cinerariifolium]